MEAEIKLIREDLEDLFVNVISKIDDMKTMKPIRDANGKNNKIKYMITDRVFSVEFVNSPPNNIGFSWDRNRNMFKLGLTLNRVDPIIQGSPLSGNEALIYLERVAKQLKIPEIFISDSSFVTCSADKTKTIDEFTLLRILQGKEGFYKKPFTNYVKRETALEAIQLLQKEFLTEEGNKLIKEYSTSSDTSVCDKVNSLLEEAKKFLKEKEKANSKSYLESIHQYILKPGTSGGKRKTKKRNIKKRKLSRRKSF